MKSEENSLEDEYIGSSVDSSLERPASVESRRIERMASRPRAIKLNKPAFLITTGLVLLIGLVGLGSLIFGGNSAETKTQAALENSNNYPVTALKINDTQANKALALGQIQRLSINGELTVNKGFVLTPSNAPSSPTRGQIYYDQKTNQPYYFNGTSFVSFTPTTAGVSQAVTSLAGASGALDLGQGLQINGTQLSVASTLLQSVALANTSASAALNAPRVSSIQGLTGAVAFSAGQGIAINGTTISSTGITDVTSSDNSISVVKNSNGTYDIKTVQGGPGSQAILLGPVGAQNQSNIDASININKIAGGDFINFARNGATVFTVDNNGRITNGTIDYANVANRPVSVVTSIDGATGAITAGSGIAVVGGALTNTGVLSVTGTANQIIVSAADGAVMFSLPQDIDTGATPTFGGLLLNGTLTVSTGGANISGATNVNGAVTVSNGNTLQVTGTTQLDNSLTVTGAATLNSSLSVAGGTSLTGTLSVASATTLNGSLTVAGSSNLTTGTGVVQFGSLGAGLVQSDVAGVLSSGAADRNNNTIFNNTLSVANGGTGVATLTSNGIIYGSGAGSLQATASAANSILATNGLSVPTLTQTLPVAVQGNIATVGTLTGGSIASGFGAISTTNAISTTGALQGGSLSLASGNFTVSGTGALVTTSTAQIQGSLSLGVPGTAAGSLVFANSNNAHVVTLQGLAPVGQDQTITIPASSFASDTVCLLSLANCAGAGGGVTATAGTEGYITKFTNPAGTVVGNSLLFDNGTSVGVNTNTPSAGYVLDVNGNLRASGNLAADGDLDINGYSTFNGSVTIGGGNTFTSGTGDVTLNGAVSITGVNTLSLGTGAATFGGTLGVSGLTSLSGGVTIVGASDITGVTNINTSGTNATTIGNGGSSFAVSSTGLNVTTAGALSGVTTISASGAISAATSGNTINGAVINAGAISGASASVTGALTAATTGNTLNGVVINAGGLSSVTGIATSGGYIQTGATANSFSGASTFTAAGTGLSVTNNASIGGNLTVQGSALSLGTSLQPGSLVFNAGNGSKGTLQTIASLGQNTIYTLPDPGTASATICLSTGNCAGAGGGITGTGTAGQLAKFTSAGVIANSGLNESGTTLSYAGNVVVNTVDTFTGNLLDVQINGVSKLAVSEAGAATLAGSLTVQSGGVNVTGNSAIAGTLTGLTGLTSAGTITFSGLGAAGVVRANASGVLSSGTVVLGTETTGNYVAALGALTGLTTTGNTGAGSTPTISVAYGSTANTAVQGNTTLICPSGTGNLTGGGNTVTLGAGGTCGSLSVVSSPAFTGDVAVQGAGGLYVGISNGSNGVDGVINFGSASNNNQGSIRLAAGGLSQSTNYVLPDSPGNATETICLQVLANCGSSNAISGSGSINKIAKFTGSQAIADSSISDDGNDVIVDANLIANTIKTGTIQSAGALNITPGGALTIGATAQKLALQGNATSTFSASANGFTTALGFTMPTANNTITLPDESGTVCLQYSNNCGFAVGGSGVTSITGSANGSVAATGALLFNNALTTSSSVTINDASTTQKGIAQFNSTNFTAAAGTINTIQNIATTSSVTFGNLTLGTAGNIVLSPTGSVATNTVKTADATSNFNIDTRGGSLVITTNNGANSFVLPSYGGLGQVICTSGITCATGGGTAVVLEPTAVQTAMGNGTALFINKQSGSGNLLQLQTGGTDAFTIDNTGNATLSGNTTANNLLVSGVLTTNVITPTGALTIGDTTHPVTIQGSGNSVFKATEGGFSTALGFNTGSGATAPTGNVVYQLQNDNTVAPGTYNICTTAGNCAGVGGSVTTTGGTAGRLAKFTSTGNIADSLVNETSNTVLVSGNLQVGISGASQLSIGVASSATGSLVFNNATNGNTISLQQTSAPSSNVSINLPTTSGTLVVGATGPLSIDATTGIISCSTCLASSGGSAGGVSSVNTLTGALTVANATTAGSTITINDAKADGTTKGIAAFNATNFTASNGIINTAQNINTTATPTFANLTLQGPGGLNLGSSTNLGQLAFKDGTTDGFSATFTPSTLTANRAISIPDAAGTLAVSASGNLALSATGNLTISNAPTFTTSVTTPTLQSTGALTITPGGALTIGANNQSLALQGNSSTSIKATSGASSTTVTFAAPTATRSIVLPDASGTVCLSSGNCLGGAAGSANTALSNLVSVAINVDLKPGAAAGANLGTTVLPFGQLVIAGGSTAPGTNNFTVTGTSTGGSRTITLPDASGTVCLQSDASCGFASSTNVVNSIIGSAGGSSVVRGAITLNNASSTGGALTINDASTSQKGIAQFNSTNFTAASGAINTVQDINSTATPTFGGLSLASALTVANGGTGAATLTNKGILYGNGAGAIQATASAANSILATNGTSTPALTQTLPTAVQGNITSTGALTAGSIGTGFGTINTANNITTSAALQGNTLSIASGNFTVNSTDVATAGNLSVNGVVNLGIVGSVNGIINFSNSTNTRTVALVAQAAAGQNSTITIPATTGATDTVCLQTLANCAGAGSGVTASGASSNYLTKFGSGNQITNSSLYDNGSFVGVNTLTNSGQVSIAASGSQTGLYVQGAASGSSSAAIVRGGNGGGDILNLQNSAGTTVAAIAATGVLTASGIAVNGVTTLNGAVSVSGTNTFTTGTGAVKLGSLGAGIVQSDASGTLSSGAIDRNSSSLLTNTLTVANGGTGAATFTSKGILYGNGGAALQVTGTSSNSVLFTDAGGTPSLGQTLPSAVQGNITGVGALISGSIANGFGNISTTNSISTTSSLQGASLSIASGAFSVATTGALTSTAAANIQGALTLGNPGATTGSLVLGNSTSTRTVSVQGLSPTGTGNATINFPSIAGGATDTVCLVTLGNCGASSGNGNYIQNGTGTQVANFNIQSASASSVAGVVKAAAGQTADIFQVQDSSNNPIVSITAAGKLSFNGSSTINLYNNGTNQLATDGNVAVGGNVALAGTGAFQAHNATTVGQAVFETKLNTDTVDRLALTAGGTFVFGGGTAAGDVNLYRSLAGTLRTDQNLSVGGALTVSGAATLTASGTALSVTNNATISGTGTIGTLTVTNGATIGNGLAVTAGGISTAGTQRVSSAGALTNITGYSQTSGDFLQSGSGTFGTGTGAVSLNGATTATSTLTVKPATNTTNAFTVVNASNATVFSVDTSGASAGAGVQISANNSDTNGKALSVIASLLSGTNQLTNIYSLPYINTPGSVGSATSIFAGLRTTNAATVVANGYGLNVGAPTITAGSVTTLTGINIQAQAATGVGTAYGIRQLGSNDLNTFAGNTTFTGDVNYNSNNTTGTRTVSRVLPDTPGDYVELGTWNGTSGMNLKIDVLDISAGTNRDLRSFEYYGIGTPTTNFVVPAKTTNNVVTQHDYVLEIISNGSSDHRARLRRVGGTDTAQNLKITINYNSATTLTDSSATGTGSVSNVYNQSNQLNGQTTVYGPNSTTAFQIQNSSAQSLFVADTTNSRIAVGPAAVAANGVLTVGTNTTVATGGIYFGTDTNLYRSAAGTLKTDSALTVSGITTINNNLRVLNNSASGNIDGFVATTSITDPSSSGASPNRFSTTYNVNGGSTAGRLDGLYSLATYNGSQTIGSASGSTSLVYFNGVQGNEIAAFNAEAWNNGTGNVALLEGVTGRVRSTSTGTTGTAYTLLARTPVVAAGGTIGSVYGLYIQPQTTAGITAAYGLYQNGTTDLNVLTGATTISNTLAVQGALTVGVAGTSAGSLVLANSSSARTTSIQALSPTGTGNATIQFPSIAGGTTDQVCLVTLANCTGANGGSGNGSYIQNGTALQTATFNIQSTGVANTTAILRAVTSQTADVLQVQSAAGAVVAKIDAVGYALFGGGLRAQSSVQIVRSLASDTALSTSLISGDTAARYRLQTDGTAYYGDGTNAADVSIGRTAAGVLGVTGALTVSGATTVGGNVRIQTQAGSTSPYALSVGNATSGNYGGFNVAVDPVAFTATAGIGAGASANSLLTLGVTGLSTAITGQTSGNVNGLAVNALNSGGADVTAVTGLAIGAGTTTTGNVYGINGAIRVAKSGGASITNSYALYASSPTITSGTITNNYGLYLGGQSNAAITNAYGIYQAGSTDSNYLAGFTTIANRLRVTTPTNATNAVSVENASSNAIFQVNTLNNRVVVNGTSGSGSLNVNTSAGNQVGLQVLGSAGQTVDLLQVLNSSGTKLASINQNGSIRTDAEFQTSTVTASTALGAGFVGKTGGTAGRLTFNGTVATGEYQDMYIYSGTDASLYGGTANQSRQTYHTGQEGSTIYAPYNGSVALSIQGAAGQGSSLLQFKDSSGNVLSAVNNAGTFLAFNGISSGGAGSNSERFGANAIASGAGAITLGKNAQTTGDNSIAIGYLANVGHASSIALGTAATTTAANQLVIGSSTAPITTGYFGNGVTNTSAASFTLQATGGSGTDNAGGSLSIAGGAGTGTGIGGNINLQIAKPGATGSTANALVTVQQINGSTGAVKLQNATNSTNGFQIQNVAGANMFNVDTANTRVTIGSAAAPTLATAQLVVSTVEIQTKLQLGNGTDNVTFDSVTGKLRLNGGSRNQKMLKLTPEYAGAVLDGAGTGTFTAGRDATAKKNYYSWTTTQNSNQTYDVVVSIPVPTDYAGLPASGNNLFIETRSSNTSAATGTISATDTSDNNITGVSGNITPSSAAAWQALGFSMTGATISADGVLTIRLSSTTINNSVFQLGNLSFVYLSQF